MTRTIVLHYHLFKNAGTSFDAILRNNFGDRWITKEFPGPRLGNMELVADWIRQHPDAVAFSTHTAFGPVPKIDGVNIVSVIFLRDPIERIRSAYKFERTQGLNTLGAKLAAQTTFEDYVNARLAINGDRQCRNFQTHRLASFCPGPEPELDRATMGLKELSLVGFVDDFDRSIAQLAAILRPDFPEFAWKQVRKNVSFGGPIDVESPAFLKLLKEVNELDEELVRRAKVRAMTATDDVQPAPRAAFIAWAAARMVAAAPDLDLQGVAAQGLDLGLLTATEAEQLSLYAVFPDWLAAGLATEEVRAGFAVDAQPLLEPRAHDMAAPAGDFLVGSPLDGFASIKALSPQVVRIDGGASVHYVANFRKLSWADEGIIAPLCDANARLLLPYLEKATPLTLEGRTFLAVVEGSSIFTHWLLDTLPRLLLVLERDGTLDGYDHFLFAATHTGFHRATLSAMGIAPSRVVTRQRQGLLFSVETFTHVSPPRHQFVAHPAIYELVTRFILPDLSRVPQSRRIYISRSKAGRRRVVNEAEIVALLEARGFEPLHLEDLTISEAGQALRAASHVVAVHGAGLSNLIFCQPGTRVLEIHGAHLSREYWVIANQCGLDYLGFEACGPSGQPLTAAVRGAMGFFERNGQDIHVPLDRFRALLDGTFLQRG